MGVIILVILIAGLLFFVGYFSPKPGGVRIETNPKATVMIDGILVGETPYEGTHKAGKMLLRLVPQGASEELIAYESSIMVASGAQTVVGRNFKSTEDDSSGYVISFEKTKSKDSAISIVSQPDGAQVLVDGVSRGFSPFINSAIAPAMHEVAIKLPNYSDFSITIRTIVGYKLSLYAKLGKQDLGEQTNLPSKERLMVTILQTPTGYLRVRTKPGEGGSEIAQIKPGEKYPYIDTDVETGWIEIQYQEPKTGMPSGMVGWISNQYASVSAEIQ